MLGMEAVEVTPNMKSILARLNGMEAGPRGDLYQCIKSRTMIQF